VCVGGDYQSCLCVCVFCTDSVFLNRGNHEDFAICCTYGFQQECCGKYSDITFGMFVEVFHHIPLFSIINNAVFVVHGGLFHCADATLEELNMIKREDFTLKDLPENGDQIDAATSRDNTVQFLKRLQRDALWSDPMDQDGMAVNPRGAGVAFGPDVTRRFLELNKLKLVVRSHECVRTGFDKPFTGDDANVLFTVFSASNYGGGGNSAAYLVFSPSPTTLTTPFQPALPPNPQLRTPVNRLQATSRSTLVAVPNLDGFDPSAAENNGADNANNNEDTALYNRGTEPELVEGVDNLYFSVFFFDLSDENEDDDDEADTVVDNTEFLYASYSDGLSLYDIILANKPQLLQEFMSLDTKQSNVISKAQWVASMNKVIKLTMSWQRMFPLLMLEECIVNNYASMNADNDDDHIMINYRMFLSSYTAALVVSEQAESKMDSITSDNLQSLLSSPEIGLANSNTPLVPDEVSSAQNNSSSKNGSDLIKFTDSVEDEDDMTLVTGNIVDTLYAQHRKLIAIFRFFDKENKGTISKDNFYKGCEILNKTLPPSSHIKDVDKLITILDVAQRGEVDINVFFEMFRLSNIHATNYKSQLQQQQQSAAGAGAGAGAGVTVVSDGATEENGLATSETLSDGSGPTTPTLSTVPSSSTIIELTHQPSVGRAASSTELGAILRRPSFRRSSSSRLRSDSVDSLHGAATIGAGAVGNRDSVSVNSFVNPSRSSPYKRISRSASMHMSSASHDVLDINGVAVSVDGPSSARLDEGISFKLGSFSLDV
jgi:diadenosine tetraphosphatase ApaH/serine/threonine PP2A family protein phosphatase